MPLLRYMALGTFLFILATRILEFQYQGMIYPEAYPDLAERSAFLGRYEIIANLCWLFFQLLISSRIFLFLGVGASNLVHPALLVLASGGLLFSFSFVPAVIAQFINQELRAAIRSPANNLLLNALPRAQWPSVQAILNGMVIPLATVVASGLLLWMPGIFSQYQLTQYLPQLSLFIGLLAIGIAFRQWQYYNQGIVELLSQKVKRSQNNKGLEADLRHYLKQDDLHQVAIALEMVRNLKKNEFIPLVGKRLVHSRSREVKRECAKTLAALPKDHASLKYLLRSLHNETDPETLAILLLELCHFKGQAVIDSARSFLIHPHPEVFSAACSCLIQQDVSLYEGIITAKIAVRLALPNPKQKLHSLHIVGQLQNLTLATYLQPYLNSHDNELNVAAFRGWVQLHKNHLQPLQRDIFNSLTCRHGSAQVQADKQLIALIALRSCSPVEDWNPIIGFFQSTNIKLVNAACSLIQRHIHHAKPVLIATMLDLQQPLPLRRQCLATVWSLLKSSQREELIPLAEKSLQRYLTTQRSRFVLSDVAHQIGGLNASKSLTGSQALLVKLLDEQGLKHLAWCMDILAFSCGEGLQFSQRLLQGLCSDNKAEQGNALEALSNCREKVLSDKVFKIFDNPLATRQAVQAMLHTLFLDTSEELQEPIFDSLFSQSVYRYWQTA